MLEDWHDFYLLIGGAAGSLIGLLFVVLSLTAGGGLEQTEQGRRLYISTVVGQLSVILGTGGLAMVPHLQPGPAGAIVAAAGLCGFAYMAWSTWTFWFSPSFKATHWTDAWCYAAAPALFFATMAASGAAIALRSGVGLMALAVSNGLLLGICIRNAWDLITWIAPRAKPGAGR